MCTEQDEVIRDDLGRTTLPRDISPGAEIEIEVVVKAGLPKGSYLLRYDMVVEGITWFEFYGSPCLRRTLAVT